MLITNVTGNFFLKENDTATEMHLAVQEVDGTPIDLSAASKVEVVIGTLEGRYLTKVPTILDAPGEFTFGLDEGDMLPTGDNLLEVHIFDETNSKRVAPSKGHYKLKVQRTIGALGLTVTTYTLDYFLSEVNRILFGLPQLLERGEALADRMDGLIVENEQLLDDMNLALGETRTATVDAIGATAASELATQAAQQATVEADAATAEAIQATLDADNATQASIAQTQAAQTATQNANTAAQYANEYGQEAEFQAFQAENATVDAQDATRAANTATDNANAASSRANTSAGRADTATTSANTAASAANTAATEANTARDSANLAASLADGIATELRGYDNAIATFSLETRYLKHQFVRFDGNTYKAKVETQGNPLPVAPARSNEWFDLVAEKGEKGDMGTGISILGKVDTVSELPASGSPGDAYLIGANIHIWDGDGWLDGGPIQGPQGEIGPQGEVGVGLQYSWNGSQLGVKRADESTYTYRDLKGEKGDKGDNAKIITLDFVIPATDTTQVDGNLINVHNYVYDAATDSIQFYQNSRILYPGEDFEMEDGTFRLLNWTGYDDPANVTFYIKVTRSVFDIDPVQSHATVVGALGYTPARSEDITQVVYDLEEADTRLTAQLAQIATNPATFGALGNGIQDDTDFIQNAIDNGNEIQLTGIFKVTKPITIPSNKKINGKNAKIVANSSQFTVLNVIGSNVLIENVEIEGAGNTSHASAGNLIKCSGTDNGAGNAPTYIKNVTIKNCKLHKAGNAGVLASYVDNLNVENCEIKDVGYVGVGATSCKNSKTNGNDIGNILPGATVGQGVNAYAVYWSQVNSSDTVRHPVSQNCESNDNTISNIPWEGLDTHGGVDIRFLNNTIRNTPVGIAIIKSDNELGQTLDGVNKATILNNRIYDCSSGVALSAVSDTKFHTDIHISGNTIESCGGSSSGGIVIGHVRNIIVSANAINKCKGSAILLRGHVYGISATGNSFKDIYNESTDSSAFADGILIRNDYVEGVFFGNMLFTSGEITATKLNQHGLRFDISVANMNVEMGSNNFEDADVARYSLTAAQSATMQPPIIQRGRAFITPTTTTNIATTNVTLPKKYFGNTTYDVIASLVATGSQLLTVEANRVDTKTISVTIKKVDGQNFASTANVAVSWVTSGF